jgi:hypothetical protein
MAAAEPRSLFWIVRQHNGRRSVFLQAATASVFAQL